MKHVQTGQTVKSTEHVFAEDLIDKRVHNSMRQTDGVEDES